MMKDQTLALLIEMKPFISNFQERYHQEITDNGWYNDEPQDGSTLCMIHSEISEALEGIRCNLMDKHLPHRPMAEVELADAILRILSFSGKKGYDIAGALAEKYLYNKTRPDHQIENRSGEHGKKF